MAVKARASVTLSWVKDVAACYRYYLLQPSTLAAPSRPSARPPGGSWQLGEPSYDGTGTSSLYTVDLTVYSDGSFAYGEVCLSSSYEAAKAAYNEAAGALDAVEYSVGELRSELRSGYVANADFGSYAESVETQIAATARQIVESYAFASLIEAANADIGELESALTNLDGEIRRGFIEDPETHDRHLGIAISESLSFTGQTLTDGGLVYFEISPNQTFGLYTASGWQFWLGGQKVGWFSSSDSMLHVSNILVESMLQLGALWQIGTDGGFGIRCIGA